MVFSKKYIFVTFKADKCHNNYASVFFWNQLLTNRLLIVKTGNWNLTLTQRSEFICEEKPE